jgi:hypothetical protein
MYILYHEYVTYINVYVMHILFHLEIHIDI